MGRRLGFGLKTAMELVGEGGPDRADELRDVGIDFGTGSEIPGDLCYLSYSQNIQNREVGSPSAATSARPYTTAQNCIEAFVS